MESAPQTFNLVGIYSPNPTTVRAKPVNWDLNPVDHSTIVFGCQKNLVIKNLQVPLESQIFNFQVQGNITCAKYSPNGEMIAFGDDKGVLKVIAIDQNKGGYAVKFENSLGAQINGICWTPDNKNMIIVGAGNERCKAVSLEGKKAGDMKNGHNKTLLCVDIVQKDNQTAAVFAGEEQEV